jgi:hypothetical protein
VAHLCLDLIEAYEAVELREQLLEVGRRRGRLRVRTGYGS